MICPKCGKALPDDAKFCLECGERFQNQQGTNYYTQPNGQSYYTQPQAQTAPPPTPTPIVINNINNNTNTNTNVHTPVGYYGRAKNKWVAFFLCFFLGYVGAHKFYEGKVGMGILYIFTVGLFGIGWLVDMIAILCKRNPYFVR